MDEAERKIVNIHEGIDSTLFLLQHRLKARPDRDEIQMIKHYGELPPLECYPGQLNQVLMNLLANAIDAVEKRWLLQKNSVEQHGGNLHYDSVLRQGTEFVIEIPLQQSIALTQAA